MLKQAHDCCAGRLASRDLNSVEPPTSFQGLFGNHAIQQPQHSNLAPAGSGDPAPATASSAPIQVGPWHCAFEHMAVIRLPGQRLRGQAWC